MPPAATCRNIHFRPVSGLVSMLDKPPSRPVTDSGIGLILSLTVAGAALALTSDVPSHQTSRLIPLSKDSGTP